VNLQEFQRILKQAFLVPILALMGLAGILLWQIADAQKAQRWLDHSDQVSTEIAELEGLIMDQEKGLRDYELTSDPSLLAPYKTAAPLIANHFASLRQMVSDNPAQEANLSRISDRYEAWLSLTESIPARPATFTDRDLNRHAEELMSGTHSAIRQMRLAESSLRQDRLEKTIVLERREITVALGGALLVGLLLSFFSLSRLHRVSGAYRQSLALLDKRREKLRTILRSIGDAVIVCEADGSIEFMNPVAEELTGWREDEAAGHPLREIFHIVNEITNEEAENPVEKVRRHNKVVALANHTVLIARSGSRHVIDDSAAPILNQEGELVGIVLVFRDVTEKRRAETALAASEKLAVAGRLAASIAHEIHNPLDSIGNLHYLLAQEPDPSKRAEYLNMAQQELDRTLQISRSLLNLYREPNSPVQVRVAELIGSVLLLLKRRLDNQGITVTHESADDLVIEGFPAELRQVFTNLIINAADATETNGRIRVRAYAAQAEEFREAGTIVEILDNGPGIPADVAPKLFQPFFTTKGNHGTGLGLWISMGIVQKHGGAIQIGNSTDPEFPGARVWVYLPAHTLATSFSRSTAYTG
jgi:PAS domain S-box-containing protein